MPHDVFVSYCSKDRNQVKRIFEFLHEKGWDVFWDQLIKPQEFWRQVLMEKLSGAACAIVVWTRNSTKSAFVAAEAAIAMNQRKMIGVLLEDIVPPPPFGECQLIHLHDWNGNKKSPEIEMLNEAIKELVPKDTLSSETPAPHSPPRHPNAISSNPRSASTFSGTLCVPINRKIEKLIPSRDTYPPGTLLDHSLSYAAELRDSRKCLIFISGLGLDFNDFHDHCQKLEGYDCIALCIIGFQPSGGALLDVSLETHAEILSLALNSIISDRDYDEILFIGFSIGADMFFLMIQSGLLNFRASRLIALDPNVNSDTLTISTVLSRISSESTNNFLLRILSEMSENTSQGVIARWINIHTYLIKILRKFQNPTRLKFLGRFSRMVCERFHSPKYDFFVSQCKSVASLGTKVDIVLSYDSNEHVGPITTLTSSIHNINVVDKNKIDHFDLVQNTEVVAQIIQDTA